MSIFETMRVSGSGLTAERLRMDVVASNIANADTTRTAAGGPYQRRQVVFSSEVNSRLNSDGTLRVSSGATGSVGQGVQVTSITSDPKAVRVVHDPSNPDADANGDVLYPDIDVTTEMTDMLAANRAYEANVTVLDATKNMALKALEIGKA